MTAPGRLAVFTTGSRNRLGMARALMATLRQHYPEADQFICIGDDPAGLAAPLGCQLVSGADIGVPGWRDACFTYDVMALHCLLKPFMFLHLIEALNYDRVFHFDTDMALFDRLHAVDAALDAGASLVITPHLLAPPGPADAPGPLGILMAGTYNTGFVAARNSDAARAALAWWAARVHEDGGVAPERGLVWDQRWMDLVPGLFAGVHITRDPTINVAYWNLPQRDLARDASGWSVAGRPLALFHFSGFDPADATRLTHHTSSLPTPLPPDLARLVAEYATLLAKHDHPADTARPYAHGQFASGPPIPPAARALFHARHRGWPEDPFETFEAYLNAPAPGAVRTPTGLVITNLLDWMIRQDLRAPHAFSLGTEDGIRAAVLWAASQHLPPTFFAAIAGGMDADTIAAHQAQSAREALAAQEALQAEPQRLAKLHAAAQDAADQEIAAANRELAALRRSASWRLTAPLRSLASLFRRAS